MPASRIQPAAAAATEGAAAAGSATAGSAAAAGSATAVSSASNQFGRPSELRIVAEARNGRTVLANEYYTMPFKLMQPLALSTNELLGGAGSLALPIQLMVMSTSAGIMAGDDQRINVRVGEGAALQVTTQAFEKVHRMEPGASARRVTRLSVASGAYLDYRPQPQIPFAGSEYAASTEVELADASSRLVYEEVLSCGRAARGERFAYRGYRNHVLVRVGGMPVYLDNTVYLPDGGSVAAGLLPGAARASSDISAGAMLGASPCADATADAASETARPLPNGALPPMDMEGTGFYEGFTHLANLVLVNVAVDDEAFLRARDYLRELTGIIGASAQLPASAASDSEAVAGGITRLASGDVAVRLLGRRAQRLTSVLASLRRMLV